MADLNTNNKNEKLIGLVKIPLVFSKFIKSKRS